MAKIIHFPKTEAQTPIDFLEEVREVIDKEQGEIVTGVLVSLKYADGHVLNGYFNLDFCGKQELVGHIQCDIIDQMIRSNPDRY